MRADALWITWERQRRSSSMAERLRAELVEIIVPGSRFARYRACIRRTIAVLAKTRPRVLYVQNPSLVLALLACTLGRRYATCVVVDTHNAGLFPLEGRSRPLQALARWIARRADLVIVSNETLAVTVREWGCRSFALPDPLPRVPVSAVAEEAPEDEAPEDEAAVVYVCTWARDEPYTEVVAAAAILRERGRSIRVRITGKAPSHIRTSALPRNVELLGFVPEEKYWAELRASTAVMVLTRRENCLTCGAYEAVAVRQAMILSNTDALRGYFSAGAVYAAATPESIATAIESAVDRAETLRRESVGLAADLEARWLESAGRLEESLSRLCDRVTTEKT